MKIYEKVLTMSSPRARIEEDTKEFSSLSLRIPKERNVRRNSSRPTHEFTTGLKGRSALGLLMVLPAVSKT